MHSSPTLVNCWIDKATRRMGVEGAFSAPLGFATLAYAASVAPLVFTGQYAFIFDRPFVLGFVGIAWSVFFYRFASQSYLHDVSGVRLAVEEADHSAFDWLRAAHLQELEDDRKHFAWAAIIWLIGAVGITLDFYEKGNSALLSPDWFGPHPLPRLLALIVLGLPSALLLATPGRMIYSHTKLICRLASLQFLPSAKLCLIGFQPLLRINRIAYLSWSIGVALVLLLARRTPSPAFIASMGAIGMIGAIAFIRPTLALRKRLEHLAQARLAQALTVLTRARGDSKSPRDSLALVTRLERSVDIQAVLFDLNWQYFRGVFTAFIVPIIVGVVYTLITKWIDKH